MSAEKQIIGNCTLYLGDCRDIIAEIGPHDACLTSPPYNLGGFHQMHNGNSNKWKYENFSDCLDEAHYKDDQITLMNAVFDVVNGPLFYSHKNRIIGGRLSSPLEWMQKTKWVIHQQVIINKGSGANVDKRRFFPVHEIMLVCFKKWDERLENEACLTDVWQVEQTNRKDADHPAVMPISMAKKALSATKAMRILDPYMGTGTTAIACVDLGKSFTGIERERKYFDMACERISRAQAQERLFA